MAATQSHAAVPHDAVPQYHMRLIGHRGSVRRYIAILEHNRLARLSKMTSPLMVNGPLMVNASRRSTSPTQFAYEARLRSSPTQPTFGIRLRNPPTQVADAIHLRKSPTQFTDAIHLRTSLETLHRSASPTQFTYGNHFRKSVTSFTTYAIITFPNSPP